MLRTALIVLLASLTTLTWAIGAQAAVVSGSLTDPQGDVIPAVVDGNAFPTDDLTSFAVRYDDAGSFVVSWHTTFGGEPWLPYGLRASVGVWDPSARACDVTTTGGVTFQLYPALDHVPPGWVYYSVVNYDGGATRDGPVYHGNDKVMTFSDTAAFARRGYNCVTNVVLLGDRGARDPSDVTFCMGPSGTVACPAIGQAIDIRWASPREGQVVSDVLHEGRSTCWAESTGPIVRTENWVDGRLHDRQTSYPWGCEWDTRQYGNGPHTLTVKAFAADGRVVEDTVRVNVSNATPMIPPALPPPANEVVSSSGGGLVVPSASPVAWPARSLSVSVSERLSRQALARRYGKRYKRRAKRGSTLTCRTLSSTRATCKVAWRYRGVRYRGTVRVTQSPRGTSATVRIKSRRP